MVYVTRIRLLMLISFCSFYSSQANVICEDLPDDLCSFSMSAAEKRCLLETEVKQTGGIDYWCGSSEVEVDGMMANYIESDECVDRRSVGISSGALLEPGFAVKLCSPECIEDCPNIVDLYSNLVAAEGSFLPDLCAARWINPHCRCLRSLAQELLLVRFSTSYCWKLLRLHQLLAPLLYDL